MVDLLIKYREGHSEISQFGLTYREAVELGDWYKCHTIPGHPYEVVSYAILPQ